MSDDDSILYEDIRAYHQALDEMLTLFIAARGWDYTCVDDALKVLARHRELPASLVLAERIEHHLWGPEKNA